MNTTKREGWGRGPLRSNRARSPAEEIPRKSVNPDVSGIPDIEPESRNREKERSISASKLERLKKGIIIHDQKEDLDYEIIEKRGDIYVLKILTAGGTNVTTTMGEKSMLEKIESSEIVFVEPIQEESFATQTQEETVIKEEIEHLPEEEREKIGWGLSTLGFKVEKAKNDFFVSIFGGIVKKLKRENRKSKTVFRFCEELRDSFSRDSKRALQKAKKVEKGEEKHRFSNASLFFGNILRIGRTITDLTGKSLASPLRYVMMGAMAMARISEAGKETRLKNEEVVESTRIHDAELAEKEARTIYERAQKKTGAKTVSAEALRNAYLMEMPKDLEKRLQNPSTANAFIQKVLKRDIENAVLRLNSLIEEIEFNPDLSDEEKEKTKEKLLNKWRESLEDYDRIITRYGTVDELALVGRYAQTASKTLVTAVTIETLVLSIEKIYETISHIFTSHDVKYIETSGSETRERPIINGHDADIPNNAPPASAEIIKMEGITFTHGKGGIEGILDLKKQIIAQYNGDYSRAPQGIQDFMRTDAVKEAIRLGLFDPNNPNESALIQEGSVLRFDEHGNLLFGKPDASGNIPILERYRGAMFDSDRSAIAEELHTKILKSIDGQGADIEPVSPKVRVEEPIRIAGVRVEEPVYPKPETAEPIPKLNIRSNFGEHLPRMFTENPFNLTVQEVAQVYDASQRNLDIIFGQESSGLWESLKNLKAGTIIKNMDMDSESGHLAAYLRSLEIFTDLKPKGIFSGLGRAETVESYIARALQKAASMGKLDDIEASVQNWR